MGKHDFIVICEVNFCELKFWRMKMVEIALKNTYSTPFIIFLFQNHFILAKFFWKTNISYPLIYTSTSACHGVRNVSFPKNFADGLNK